MTALHLASWIGYLMAILTGIRISASKHNSVFFTLLACLICSFGGGFVFRDLLLLRVVPRIISSPLEILNVILLSLIFLEYKHILPFLDYNVGMCTLLSMIDGIGLAGFVISGCQIESSFPILLVLSGVVTGTGGGFIGRCIFSINPPLNLRYIILAAIIGSVYTSNCFDDTTTIIAIGGLFCPLTDQELTRKLWLHALDAALLNSYVPSPRIVYAPTLHINWHYTLPLV